MIINLDDYLYTQAQLRVEIGEATEVGTEVGAVTDAELDAIIERNKKVVELRSETYSDPITSTIADNRAPFTNFIQSVGELRENIGGYNSTIVADGDLQRIINRVVKSYLKDRVSIPQHFSVAGTGARPEPAVITSVPAFWATYVLSPDQLREEIGSPPRTRLSDNELVNIINRNIKERLDGKVPIPDWVVGATTSDPTVNPDTVVYPYADYIINRYQLRSEIGSPNERRISDVELVSLIERVANELLKFRRVNINAFPNEVARTEDNRGVFEPYVISALRVRTELGNPSTSRIPDYVFQDIINRAVATTDLHSIAEKMAHDAIRAGEFTASSNRVEMITLPPDSSLSSDEGDENTIKSFTIPEEYFPVPLVFQDTAENQYTRTDNVYTVDEMSPYVRHRFEVRGRKVYANYIGTGDAKIWLLPLEAMYEYLLSRQGLLKALVDGINAQIIKESQEAMARAVAHEQENNAIFIETNERIIAKARDLLDSKTKLGLMFDEALSSTNQEMIKEAMAYFDRKMAVEKQFDQMIAGANEQITVEAKNLLAVRLEERTVVMNMINTANQTILKEALDMLSRKITELTRQRGSEQL